MKETLLKKSQKGKNKGRIPWNKGKVGIYSDETRQRMSIIAKNRKFSDETKKKMSLSSIGNKISSEARKKISDFFKGRPKSPEHRLKLSLSRKGKHYPNIAGENSSNWKGGITPINQAIRNSIEYKLWRKAVFERDNYTCIWCGAKSISGRSVILNADHIKEFFRYPELRFAIDNGRTLCLDCHKTTESYGIKK